MTTADIDDKELLSLLTDEERAALAEELNEGQVEDEGAAGGEGGTPDAATVTTTDADVDAAAKAQAEADAKAAADAAAAKAAQDAAAATAQPQAETTAATAVVPQPSANPFPDYAPPEGAKERLEEIERQRVELTEQFDAGEMMASEYRAKLKPLDQEERQISDQKFRAELSRDIAVARWEKTDVPEFIGAHPEYSTSPLLFSMLDTKVREIQAARPADALHPKILAEAHEAIRTELAGLVGQTKPTADPSPTTTTTAVAQRGKLPPTLATVPASDITQAVENRFAGLDRLSETDPVAYEQAMAKMSDADREAYLQSA